MSSSSSSSLSVNIEFPCGYSFTDYLYIRYVECNNNPSPSAIRFSRPEFPEISKRYASSASFSHSSTHLRRKSFSKRVKESREEGKSTPGITRKEIPAVLCPSLGVVLRNVCENNSHISSPFYLFLISVGLQVG